MWLADLCLQRIVCGVNRLVTGGECKVTGNHYGYIVIYAVVQSNMLHLYTGYTEWRSGASTKCPSYYLLLATALLCIFNLACCKGEEEQTVQCNNYDLYLLKSSFGKCFMSWIQNCLSNTAVISCVEMCKLNWKQDCKFTCFHFDGLTLVQLWWLGCFLLTVFCFWTVSSQCSDVCVCVLDCIVVDFFFCTFTVLTPFSNTAVSISWMFCPVFPFSWVLWHR